LISLEGKLPLAVKKGVPSPGLRDMLTTRGGLCLTRAKDGRHASAPFHSNVCRQI